MRCSSINVILAIAFGIEGVSSPEDELYKKVVEIIETGLYFSGVIGDFSAYFPILSFLDVIFRKERKMRHFVNDVSHPTFRELIQAARDSDEDSLVKKIDLIKDQYDIDEQNIIVIMSRLYVPVVKYRDICINIFLS